MGNVTADTDDRKTDFPRSWNWEEDGEQVEGTFVELGEAPTAGYGYRPILTLEVGGEPRTVWVFHTSLAEKLRDELARRKAKDFTAGEHIVIRRSERKTSETTGRTYVPYKVVFPDAPKRTAAEVLGAVVAEEENDDQKNEDDEIPF